METPDRDCRRTQHCENHHQGWTIAGTIIAVGIVVYAIQYFGSTPCQFPPIKEEIREQSRPKTNEIDLLKSHLIPGPLYPIRQ